MLTNDQIYGKSISVIVTFYTCGVNVNFEKRFTETSHLGQSAESTHILDELEHDIIQIDMHDTDSILDNVSENFLVTDCGHIRNLLLTTHKHILIEMLILTPVW